MLSVTHLDGRCEPLNHIQNANLEEEVNGAFTLSLTSFLNDDPGYDLLNEESIIDLKGQSFRVKDLTHKRNSKTVQTNSTFFDLLHHFVEGIQGGTRTAEEQAAFILAGTGWTFEVQGDLPPQLFLNAFGNSNVVQLIRLMCETLKCEVRIMPDKHLIFAQQIGKDEDFQYRYKHNIKELTRSVDTTDLFTAIKATGGNGVTVEYRAPTYDLYGPRYAEPVTNDEMTSTESLLEFAKQELGERYLPQISIDVSVSQMNAQGYEDVPGLGDRIWLIYEPMGIEFKTRVMKRKGNPFKKDGLIVTLSNVKATFSDVLVETKVEIDKNKREFRSKIEQTNERITFEVERLDGEVLEAYARIQIESDRITSEVGRLDGDILTANSRITQLADSITLEVQKIDENFGELETQVQFNAGEISSKVSYTDYNGIEMISRINQTAAAVKISAQNIDLNGIVRVADSIELGTSGNGKTKAVKFNGTDAWIYSSGIDSLTLDSGTITMQGGTYFAGAVSFYSATSVDWGTHAPPARWG
ncbi:phage tail spike protein [Domibacillus mangrovi]|uniref:Prophage tail endopeptidase domain-containing protein n=1 Tax=Domibacillus mangrovi TaxID=1714354 RepID=A0A1Q5P417_9BACI|nr:phage tail spike protein [Domibacillus mangrovi]OKL36986.1 hypothetical protein BLL40_05185 [Domibacillus mangrovi]